MTDIFTLFHDDIVVPIEDFFIHDIEPAAAEALVELEKVGETFMSQFETGIGAAALAQAVTIVNAAPSLSSIGDVVALAGKVGDALLAAAEATAQADAPALIAGAQTVILNAARTVFTSAVINASKGNSAAGTADTSIASAAASSDASTAAAPGTEAEA